MPQSESIFGVGQPKFDLVPAEDLTIIGRVKNG
jgi:hypothetical protein